MYRFILVLMVMFFSVLTEAQLRMGLTVSPQVSWLKSDVSTVSSDGVQMGFNFGLVADLFFTNRYSISTGVTINNTGGRLKYADSLSFESNDIVYKLDPNASIKYNMQYVDIPFSFRMESNQIGYFVYYAQFGITNHLLVGAAADVKSTTITLDGVGCKKELSFYNMSYNIGVGTDYYVFKHTAISFGVLFVNGFLDITQNTGLLTSDNVSLKSVVLKLGVLF